MREIAVSVAIDPALFRETLGHYPTGVAVVTAIAGDGRPAGMVVGTFSSVSLDPPLIAFFPASSSGSFRYLRTAQHFCINVLASDQEPLCRQLATGGPNKFDGVKWRPGPLGSPILDGVVSWIECEFEDIREAGDHFIVLGRVRQLDVQRSTLPLLFFQGGYGRFTPRSLIAAPDPDLIQAAQLAQSIRSQVEELSIELAVNCSVVAKLGDDSVQVLAANQHAHSREQFPLGHRQPIVPPLGAVFLLEASPADVQQWVGRAPDDSWNATYLELLDTVRDRGYSVLAAAPDVLERHQAVLSAFEKSDRLPRHERAVRQATSELVDLFCPELVVGERYDIASIVVPITTEPGLPPMAVRATALPTGLTTEQIESWVEKLKQVAAGVGGSMTGAHR